MADENARMVVMKKQGNRDSLTKTLQREQGYRQQGWWTGELLQDRYASIVTKRGGDLAVADNRGQRLTHSELWSTSGALADALRQRGLREGEVIILFLPNWVEWQVALLRTCPHALTQTTSVMLQNSRVRVGSSRRNDTVPQPRGRPPTLPHSFAGIASICCSWAKTHRVGWRVRINHFRLHQVLPSLITLCSPPAQRGGRRRSCTAPTRWPH